MSSRNEAAERLLQAISDKHTEDYSGITDWDEAVGLIESYFAAEYERGRLATVEAIATSVRTDERRATVERIKRLLMDNDGGHESTWVYAILDEEASGLKQAAMRHTSNDAVAE